MADGTLRVGEIVVDCDYGAEWKRYHYPVDLPFEGDWSYSGPYIRKRVDHHFQAGRRPAIAPMFGATTPDRF